MRDGCTACIADCYRDSSVMLHFAVSTGDSVELAKKGRPLAALRTMLDKCNLVSLAAVAEDAYVLSPLARRG